MTETDVKPDEPALSETEAAPPDHTAGLEPRPNLYKAGMACFLASEVAFFSTLITVYVIFLFPRKIDEFPPPPPTPPTPSEVLTLPLVIFTTICLLSSSVTIHLAEGMLRAGKLAAFRGLWALTILLGAVFIAGTAYEWNELITVHGLVPGSNMFGTTYYTLVGFHAFHVTMGLVALSVILGLSLRGHLPGSEPVAVTLVGWYWHFVDVVWVIVFTIVYLVGR